MALGKGKAHRKARRASRQAGRKAKISSFKGDGNALKSKFGIGRSLSNKFDQRVGDGLEDLFNGLLGARTSNIPEISAQVREAKEANRKDRQNKIANLSEAREKINGAPPTNQILSFPKQYFNERGEGVGHEADVLEEGDENWDKVPKDITDAHNAHERNLARQTAFPNSIHFRSLPRRKFDTSAAWYKVFGNKIRKTDTSGDINPGTDQVFDIFLYLPHNLGDAVKVSWEDADAGVVDQFFARLFSGGDSNELMGGDRGLDMKYLQRMIAKQLPGGAILQRSAGAMANPMKFQTFTGVNFRNYTYKFTLKPSSADEAREIRAIIAALKYSTLPGTAGHNDRIWTMPNEWVIKFQGPIKNWIDFPLTVVCTDVEVDYAAGASYTLMEDGAPQAIDLTVSFRETTQLSRQKYVEHVSAQMGANRVFAKGTKIIPEPPTTEEKSGNADIDIFEEGGRALKPGDNLGDRIVKAATFNPGPSRPSINSKLTVQEQRADDFVSNLPVSTGRANPFRVVEGKPESGWMRVFDGAAGYKDRPKIRKFLRKGPLNIMRVFDKQYFNKNDPGG